MSRVVLRVVLLMLLMLMLLVAMLQEIEMCSLMNYAPEERAELQLPHLIALAEQVRTCNTHVILVGLCVAAIIACILTRMQSIRATSTCTQTCCTSSWHTNWSQRSTG
jgi:hypothetical protein